MKYNKQSKYFLQKNIYSFTICFYFYKIDFLLVHAATLVKKARWSFAKGNQWAAFVLAEGGVAIPYYAASICLVTTSGLCAPIAGAILATVDIAIAAIILGQSEGDISKRSIVDSDQWLGIYGHYVNITEWPHSNGTVVSNVTNTPILFHYIATSYPSKDGVAKRDDQTILNSLIFSSEYGSHIASSHIHSVTELSNLVVNAIQEI
ncbi:hypothetical protein TPHA_0J00145 [Tetrapisispora phaffii CBS 4417]|uniref:Uncharacterized protein n=1 Tax=Tetrapisispora phaffii (strain ATCC 24235 / CBS 4417 / NBRC 1672 / NRRL Y-8282 / UCD 70-5) TaxID=1071381 RepID=G8BY97_TETPH|nr:hypothetical protein TPHA_0J00145 [Tetrapisispora phaffii CBS 4417]CCE64839.1 hypothetical protein TPHA_0J00145 [Tetrapisispora phaffii CBS 4417]